MISIMLDANIYRKVINPEDCSSKDTFIFKKNCEIIHNYLKNNKIQAYLSEAIFLIDVLTIEEKIKIFFPLFAKKNKKILESIEIHNKDGSIKTIELNKNLIIDPEHKYYQKYLAIASYLGVKIVRNSRISIPYSIIPSYMFLKIKDEQEFHKKNNLRGQVLEELDQNGINSLINLFNSSNTNDNDEGINYNIQQLSIKELKIFFSEWADRDAIAGCIGYDIDYFCTEDQGIKSGKDSIFYKDNRIGLEKNYGIKIVNIDELSEILKSIKL